MFAEWVTRIQFLYLHLSSLGELNEILYVDHGVESTSKYVQKKKKHQGSDKESNTAIVVDNPTMRYFKYEAHTKHALC